MRLETISPDIRATNDEDTRMSMADALLAELAEEMKTTRRVIERVPSEKGDWKPHPKSFSLAHLTQLVSSMPGWITKVVQGENIDLSEGPGYTNQKTESLLQQFDTHVAEARAAIGAAKDGDYLRMLDVPVPSIYGPSADERTF